MTTDYESWILSCLSKISNNIFEFGTCSGKNTYLMALNSNQEAKIVSLTLNSEQSKKLTLDKKDNNISIVIDKKYTVVSKVESDITKKLLVILDKKIKKIDIK